MARDHGRVLCKIWQDKDFRALPRTAQALYIQLLSQPNVNNAGVLPLMLSKWGKGCDDLTREELTRDLAVLVDASFIIVDTDSEEVLIRSFIRNDGGMAHKYIFKNALKMAEAVESGLIRRALAVELRRIRSAEAARVAEILDPSETDSEPVTATPEPDSNADVNPSESHSNTIPNASESHPENGMPSESHSDHCGEGEGEGVGETPVVGHLGGVARTPAPDAHTREEPPTLEEIPATPFCDRHPGGTPDNCRACADRRKRYEATAAQRAEAEAAQRRAEARAKSDAARTAADDRARAIAGCGMCDDDGELPGGAICDHDPDRLARAARGVARARAALCKRCRGTSLLADGTECDHQTTDTTEENRAHA
ncbi:hypothetical protein [Nocardia sp. N2S4-5]|uniref:hypothetical protein n=1 Tax=Nocardia sp. N2S4-5 TaxID=3351565 RepID=UPI0037CF9022